MKQPKSRAPLLLLVLAGLGALVLIDNAPWETDGGSTSNVVMPAADIARAPPSTPPASAGPGGPGLGSQPAATLPQPATAALSDDDRLAMEALNPLAALERDKLTETVTRPLFTASRRAYKRPATPPPRPVAVRKPTPRATKPTYDLLGVIIGRNSRIAVLRSRGGTADITAKPGDKLGKWQVKSVARDSVTLAQGDNSYTLQVFPEIVSAAPRQLPAKRKPPKIATP